MRGAKLKAGSSRSGGSGKKLSGETPDCSAGLVQTGQPRGTMDPMVRCLMDFLERIGLPVRLGPVEESSFLPGILIDRGVIVVDESKLKYPGDLLHEAGHLAVLPAARRNRLQFDAGNDGGEEMAAIAWSYAAALHLGLDPAVVFHEGGYRGGSAALLENFSAGRYLGLPMLQWLGLAEDQRTAAAGGRRPYPEMVRWVSDR